MRTGGSLVTILSWAALLVLSPGPAARAQAPSWPPTMATGVTITSLAPLDDDHVLIAGLIQGTDINFEGIPKQHSVVGKWSVSQRRFLWQQPMDYATALAVRGSNVYVACRRGWGINEPSHHTKIQVGDTIITSQVYGEGSEAFLVKLADKGSSSKVQWIKQLGQSGYLTMGITALTVRGPAVYLGGGFHGDGLRFDAIQVTDSSATESAHFHGPSCNDGFVAKLLDEGQTARFEWAQKIDGQGGDYDSYDTVTALAVQDSSVYVTGQYSGRSLALGNLTIPKPEQTEQWRGYSDMSFTHAYLARITDHGARAHFDWAQLTTGPGEVLALALAVSGPNVYLTGHFYGVADMGPVRLRTTAGRDSADMFVAKVRDTGTGQQVVWAWPAGTQNSRFYPGSLVVRGQELYVGGYLAPDAWQPAATAAPAPAGCVVKLLDEGPQACRDWLLTADSTQGFTRARLLIGRGAQVYVAGEQSWTALPVATAPSSLRKPKRWFRWRK